MKCANKCSGEMKREDYRSRGSVSATYVCQACLRSLLWIRNVPGLRVTNEGAI